MFSFTLSLRHSGLGQLRLVGIRLLLGLMQGLALYALSPVQGQPAPLSDLPYVLLPLQLTVLLLPLLLIDVVGALKGAALWRWGLLAAVLLWALGAHEVWRQGSAVPAPHFSLFQKSGLLLAAGFGFFVAESLLLAGAADQRRMASYATCFDTTWKLLLQWQISVLFVAGLWLVLWFGAANFSLLGLDGPKRLLKQDWFALPLSCSALACALHLYDQRPALVLGGRTMLLTLLSWMLPLASLAVGGFLLALPWTGLQPLWSTGHASWVLLGTLLALVLLINATLQDCRSDHRPPRVLDWSGRMAVCCLLPLVLIAAYALAGR